MNDQDTWATDSGTAVRDTDRAGADPLARERYRTAVQGQYYYDLLRRPQLINRSYLRGWYAIEGKTYRS